MTRLILGFCGHLCACEINFAVAMLVTVHNMETMHGLYYVLTASENLFCSLKYKCCPGNCNCSFQGHPSYFRKYFQMLFAVGR